MEVQTPPGMNCSDGYILGALDSLPPGIIQLNLFHKFKKMSRNLRFHIMNATGNFITVPVSLYHCTLKIYLG